MNTQLRMPMPRLRWIFPLAEPKPIPNTLPIAMIIGQIVAGVTVDPVISGIFVIISVSGIILGIMTLKNIKD